MFHVDLRLFDILSPHGSCSLGIDKLPTVNFLHFCHTHFYSQLMYSFQYPTTPTKHQIVLKYVQLELEFLINKINKVKMTEIITIILGIPIVNTYEASSDESVIYNYDRKMS